MHIAVVKDSNLNMLHDKTKEYTNIKEYEKINLGNQSSTVISCGKYCFHQVQPKNTGTN